LKKFQHLVKVGKEEINDKKVLNSYLDSPVDALIEKSSFVNSTLERVKRSISSDAIYLKDKSKILSEIDWMINHNIFVELAMKHNSMMEEMEGLEDAMSKQSANKLRSEIESRIEHLDRDAQTITEELERNKKQTEKIEISVKERKTSLERSLTVLRGSKTTITLS
jgi:predicted  nucleic acid-binding Zn-ribbon protein